MSSNKKLQWDRYKKTAQGITQFASLLEQADPPHRRKILSQLESEDPPFLAQVLKRVVFFEELIWIDSTILAEIFSKASPRLIITALENLPSEFREKIYKLLPYPLLKQVREGENKMLTVTTAESGEARKQILKFARELEAQNKFTFELSESALLLSRGRKQAS
jgi:flagellar motor switch protein FliG